MPVSSRSRHQVKLAATGLFCPALVNMTPVSRVTVAGVELRVELTGLKGAWWRADGRSGCLGRPPGGDETMEKIPMTAAGYAALESEPKHCQQVERPRIIQQITDARTHGDLSENAEYHAAKETQSINEGRIAELEDKLARADIIDVSK